MKNSIRNAIAMVMIIACGNTFAHGAGGGTSSYEAEKSGIKFNIDSSPTDTDTYGPEPRLELSVDGQTIHLKIISPDGKPIDTEFADAKTFVTSGGGITKVYLWPAGDNVLSGKGDFTTEPGMRIEVRLNLPGRETIKKDFFPSQ